MSAVILPEQSDSPALFAQFEFYCPTETQTGFIRTIKHLWYKNSIHLLCCDFDTDSFTEHCFSLYGLSQPDEIQNAVKKRKAEFLAGRFVAQRALSALGMGFSAEQLQVGVAADRSPVWPEGVTGSITHTASLAFCCVGRTAEMNFIGIDSEVIVSASTAQHIAAEIHNSTELALMTAAGFPVALAATLIFSAKESLYKALYPKVRCFFGFEVARVNRVDGKSHSLILSLSDSFSEQYGLNTEYKIQFCIKGTVVHTLLMQ